MNRPPKTTSSTPPQTSIYELQAEICSALASPVRLQILDLLAQGEKTNSDLLAVLSIPKANLSQHLNVLKNAGILKARKQGLFQYVSVAIPQVKEACTLIRRVLLEKVSGTDRHSAEVRKELASPGAKK